MKLIGISLIAEIFHAKFILDAPNQQLSTPTRVAHRHDLRSMTVEQVLRILYPGVQGLLSQTQASNLVLSLMLLAVDPIDSETLRFLRRFFTPSDYDDLIQERTVMHICSYPLCGNTLKNNSGGPRLTGSLSAFPWAQHYCSRHCFKSSLFYKHQLSTETLVTRRDVAFAPYGTMKYENEVLLLDQVEQYARSHNLEFKQAIVALLQGTENLDTKIHELSIEPGDETPVLTNIAIEEKNV